MFALRRMNESASICRPSQASLAKRRRPRQRPEDDNNEHDDDDDDDEAPLMNFSSKIDSKNATTHIYVLIGCFLMSGTTGWDVILYVRISVKEKVLTIFSN